MNKRRKQRSDGVNHARITLALVPIAALVGAALVFFNVPIGTRVIIAVIGCLCGVPMMPDLDLSGWSISETIFFHIPIVGWVLGYFWSMIWYPYAKMFTHRGTSHTPLVGTIVRVLYLPVAFVVFAVIILITANLILAVFGVVGFAIPFSAIPPFLLSVAAYWQHILIWMAGLSVSDIGHIVRDKTGLTI